MSQSLPSSELNTIDEDEYSLSLSASPQIQWPICTNPDCDDVTECPGDGLVECASDLCFADCPTDEQCYAEQCRNLILKYTFQHQAGQQLFCDPRFNEECALHLETPYHHQNSCHPQEEHFQQNDYFHQEDSLQQDISFQQNTCLSETTYDQSVNYLNGVDQETQKSSASLITSQCKWVINGHRCNQAFDTEEELQEHVEKVHIDVLEKAQSTTTVGFLCHWENCDRNKSEQEDDTSDADLSNENDLQESERSRTKCFPSRPKLKRHVQTHTDYKPYGCDYCKTRMKTKDAILKHIRTHTGEKPHICGYPGCGKSFTTGTELKTHTTVHTKSKPHKCSVCGESFADSSNLSKHKKIHFNNPWKCETCGKTMARFDQMKRHWTQTKHMLYLTDPAEVEAYRNRCLAVYNQELKNDEHNLKSKNSKKRPFELCG